MNLHGAKLPDIALFAPLYSGKTAVADYLEREYGYTRVAFANEVRYLVVDMINLVHEKAGLDPITVDDLNANKATFRPFLQWLGTDYVRDHLGARDFWVDRLKERIATIDGPVVVDDMRFPNEAEAFRKLGFRFVRVDAPERFRFDYFLSATTYPVSQVADKWEEVNSHPSEQYYDAIQKIAHRDGGDCYVIRNDDDLDTLFDRTEEMVLALTYGKDR